MTPKDASRSDNSDMIGTARALTAALDRLRGQLEAAMSYGRRNRRMIWGLVISLALDAALTVALTVLTIQVGAANDKTSRVHDRQVATCQSGNESRQAQIQLWDYLLALPPPQPPTEAQKRQRALFKAYVHRVFTPRDCSRI